MLKGVTELCAVARLEVWEKVKLAVVVGPVVGTAQGDYAFGGVTATEAARAYVGGIHDDSDRRTDARDTPLSVDLCALIGAGCHPAALHQCRACPACCSIQSSWAMRWWASLRLSVS